MSDPLGTPVAVATADNGYFLISVSRPETHSAQLCHHDGTTAGTWSVYTSNQKDPPIPTGTATPDLEYWSLDAATPASPDGSAAGSTMATFADSGAKLYLIRFLASATSSISVYPHGKD